MPTPNTEVTHLLQEWSAGDKEALDQLIPLIIEDACDMARKALAGESPGHTLQPTALVNEAYKRLVDRKSYPWRDRKQFFKCLAELMRRILVDHARRKKTAKRGGGEPKLSLEEGLVPALDRDLDIEALHDALEELKRIDERRHDIVMLWYFVGLTQEEIAEELGISVNTVGRQLRSARRWLKQRLSPPDS